MTVQFQLFDTAALIDNLQLAFELSATTETAVEVEPIEETYSGAQVGAAIAKLRMLPKKPHVMTVTELRAECKRLGLKGYSKWSKAQLLGAIATVTAHCHKAGDTGAIACSWSVLPGTHTLTLPASCPVCQLSVPLCC